MKNQNQVGLNRLGNGEKKQRPNGNARRRSGAPAAAATAVPSPFPSATPLPIAAQIAERRINAVLQKTGINLAELNKLCQDDEAHHILDDAASHPAPAKQPGAKSSPSAVKKSLGKRLAGMQPRCANCAPARRRNHLASIAEVTTAISQFDDPGDAERAASMVLRLLFIERHAGASERLCISDFLRRVSNDAGYGSSEELSENETYSLAEIISAAQKLDRCHSNRLLRGYVSSLRNNHPAKAALTAALTATNRDDRLALIEVGGFSASFNLSFVRCAVKVPLRSLVRRASMSAPINPHSAGHQPERRGAP